MKARCEAPKHAAYPDYGGRGITYCARWRLFPNFLADMGRKPPGMSLERKDVNGPYNKKNCIWATPIEQANNKRSNRRLTINGTTHTVAEWLRLKSINRSTFDDRIAHGWSLEEALNTPAGTATNNAKSRMITHEGKTMCLSQWSRETGINATTILQRMKRGWSLRDALFIPKQPTLTKGMRPSRAPRRQDIDLS